MMKTEHILGLGFSGTLAVALWQPSIFTVLNAGICAFFFFSHISDKE